MWTWFIDKERILFRCKLREKVLGRLFWGYCSFACSWLKDIDYLDRNNTSKHCRKYPCLFDKLVRVWAQMNTSACEKRSKKDEPNFRVLVRLPVRKYCYPNLIRSREICKGSRKPRCMSLMVFAASQTSNVSGISIPDIVESFDFLMAKFSWHSWIALFREFKSSTKDFWKKTFSY